MRRFDSQVALDKGQPQTAAHLAYQAMVGAARSLVQTEITDVSEEPERIVTNYDFKHPARVNKTQLRTLENLHDNFARLLSSTLSRTMRQVVDVDTAFVDQTTYAEFIMSLSNPAMSYQFTLGPTWPMRLSEVEEVQLNIIQKVRELEKQGQLTIVRGIPDDQFV